MRKVALEAVVFDLDGTLADTIDLIVHALNEVLADVWGGRRTLNEVRPLFGPPDDELIRRALPPGRDPRPVIEAYYQIYARDHGRYARVFPGVPELLTDLTAHGLKLGLLTNKARRAADLSLRALGLDRYFPVVVSGSEAPSKPDPRGLALVLGELGVPPTAAAYVGDAPSDVRTARAAGTQAVAVLWGRTHPLEALLSARPDHQVAEPEELAALLLGTEEAGAL